MLHVINLARRTDRKEYMRQLLDKEGLVQGRDYTFVKAVDGRELRVTDEIRTAFAKNEFQFRRGILGCALTHIALWKQLVADTENESYIVVEDDITLCPNFKERLAFYRHAVESNEACDILFLGFTLHDSFGNRYASTENPCEPLTWKYYGGTFGYILRKCGANKLLDQMAAHGVHRAIDHFISDTPSMRMWNAQPHVVYSDSTDMNSAKDSDIQYDFNSVISSSFANLCRSSFRHILLRCSRVFRFFRAR
jgi:GR25 family glycosyltransferase involved in LPS biosynthesis